MNDKLIRPLNREIIAALAEREGFSLSGRRVAATLTKASGWTEGLSALLPIRERLSCAQVLEACACALEAMGLNAPEEGWSTFCYDYVRRHIMFPEEAFASRALEFGDGAVFCLTVLQLLLDREREVLPFDPLMDFQFLPPEMSDPCVLGREYRRFLSAWRKEYIYEMMRLGLEVTPFRTLNHIAGVHYIAMVGALGLKEAGVELDLALASGAAASHDLGKFGCRPGENVPFLHYYYTDQWLLARGMEGISHIASNHSTWDLELESLSAESLLLIYADFRSKQTRDEQGREKIILFPLEDSFQVILKKLENVDAHKKHRYEFVYGKLHDFEDYMRHLGVDVDLTGQPQEPAPHKDPALMNPQETLDGLVRISVEHNIRLMHMLSDEQKFGNIIEAARSAKSWQQLRAYLNIFEEYCTYLSVRQKKQALAFLYELLVHREGDIRRQAGSLMGRIIAQFHLVYRKRVPADAPSDPAEEVPFTLWGEYLDKFIFPDHRIPQQQRNQIGYLLKMMLESMLIHAREGDIPRFLAALFRYYEHPEELEDDTAFTLLDAICHLPPNLYGEEVRGSLLDFAGHFAASENLRLVTAALQFLRQAQRSIPQDHPHMARIADIARAVPGEELTTVFLKCRILRRAGEDTASLERTLYQSDITSEVFLDNLKSSTPWVVKVAGVELLRDQVEHGIQTHVLHIATHFSNLVKVSERVVVRHTAGAALVSCLTSLRRDQRNEVVVELGKGLEMGQYEISKYIPQYLGEAALYLHPSELDEQVIWLKTLLGSPNDSAVAGALNTIAVLLQHYPAYRDRFSEDSRAYEHRREVLLGMLLQGMAHYRPAVRQEALLVTGNLIFESPVLLMEEKSRLFSLSYRKLLYLIQEATALDDSMTFFYRAAALADIYRFISLWRLDHGSFSFEAPKKIAFFPGTFDPFTLSHKGIVQAIRDMGFEVYLSVDEFSWSKNAQPSLIRRQIVNMSVAGDFHVNLFPVDIPVNIANPRTLRRLLELFPNQKVYVVVGSDVPSNASSYKAPSRPWSIHRMNHIIFRRAGEPELPKNLPITGDVIRLQLPSYLKDISSTRIREGVDSNRDISNLIDPVIQDFIYQNGLYLRGSQNKPMLEVGQLEFKWLGAPDLSLLGQMSASFPELDPLRTSIARHGDRMLILRHKETHDLAGFVSYRTLATSQLFSALGDPDLANRVRLRASGRVLLITALSAREDDERQDLVQLLLSELLAKALEESCVYAVFFPYDQKPTPRQEDVLTRAGFAPREGNLPLWEVDMHTPVVLIQNLETAIQEPLSQNPRVLAAIRRSHRRLQLALSRAYSGSLLLTLSSDVIHNRLLQKITTLNNVPSTPVVPRSLGENMCVPYGKLLRGKTVPNTVTKTIHTDKVYSPDLSQAVMEAFPNYTSIPCQIRTLKAFDRPVILVDDLMHPGFRFQALDPWFRQEDVPIRMVLVGVLSARGKDLMQNWERPVDSVYFLPILRQWFVEATLFPFIGGNTVRRPQPPVPGLLPGINHILPYTAPSYLKECGQEAVFQLSKTCLEGALEVFQALEQEYRNLYGRNLTLSRLPEAVILPLCPDKGNCLRYDPNLSASVYLENDLEELMRQNW